MTNHIAAAEANAERSRRLRVVLGLVEPLAREYARLASKRRQPARPVHTRARGRAERLGAAVRAPHGHDPPFGDRECSTICPRPAALPATAGAGSRGTYPARAGPTEYFQDNPKASAGFRRASRSLACATASRPAAGSGRRGVRSPGGGRRPPAPWCRQLLVRERVKHFSPQPDYRERLAEPRRLPSSCRPTQCAHPP